MPGIYEANTASDSVQSETPVQSESMEESAAQSSSLSSPSDVENDDQENPPQEIDQTDKINKFLLKSFLQHINNDPINEPSEPAEVQDTNGESDGDWEWRAKWYDLHYVIQQTSTPKINKSSCSILFRTALQFISNESLTLEYYNQNYIFWISLKERW